MRYALRGLSVVAFAMAALVLSAIFGRSWYSAPQPFESCVEQGLSYAVSAPEFQACSEHQAMALLTHDYLEFKDLGKALLTLLSATLVVSITFSEKVVDLDNAPAAAVSALFACWGLLFVAIATCGAGLVFMSHAAWVAKYDMRLNFLHSEVHAVTLLMGSLGSFVCALAALVIAGAVSVVRRRLWTSLRAYP